MSCTITSIISNSRSLPRQPCPSAHTHLHFDIPDAIRGRNNYTLLCFTVYTPGLYYNYNYHEDDHRPCLLILLCYMVYVELP